MWGYVTGDVLRAPAILETAWQLERYGAEALGLAPISIDLIRRLSLAETIYRGYKSRLMSKDWVEWAKSNGSTSNVLMWAERVAGDNG